MFGMNEKKDTEIDGKKKKKERHKYIFGPYILDNFSI